MDCPLFSIIIPHKDIPDLLMRCLRSIPMSEDIQVIVVDDNSADADTYLDKYPELSRPYLEFIRTTKSGGAGYARNVGLEHAKGKWILFADADDFYVENMPDIIYSYADSEADVIYFKNKSVLSEDTSIEAERFSGTNKNIDKYLADGDEWPIKVTTYGPHCKMIKKNLVDKYHIRFEEIMCYEEHSFCLLIGCNVSVSVFPHCSIARKLLLLHPCIKKCTIMDAKKDYSHVISGYRNELRLNGKATLSAYCRSVGVSISAVHHWMENYGITTKKIKAEVAELAGCDSPFVPLSSEMPVPVRSSSRIELTFPNGVLLSADQYPPQDLLVLLNGYRGGRV